MKGRDCLECGFITTTGEDICKKCDAVLSAQSDGSTVKVDIAHQNETVVQATEKLGAAIKEQMAGYTQTLVVVTGRGRIKGAVWPQLEAMAHAGKIVAVDEEPHNPGALLVTLRH